MRHKNNTDRDDTASIIPTPETELDLERGGLFLGQLILLVALLGVSFIFIFHKNAQLNQTMYGVPYCIDSDKDALSVIKEVNLACARIVTKKHLKIGKPIPWEDILTELPKDYSAHIQHPEPNVSIFYPDLPGRTTFIISLDKVPNKGWPFAIGLKGDRFFPSEPPVGSELRSVASRFYDGFPKKSSQSQFMP